MERKKLIEKFVKKDYNNKLEEVLAKKMYNEEVKNLLLDILYKVEVSYKDYDTVKKNVLTKERYILDIINCVKKYCDNINFINPSDMRARSFAVNKKRKQIICYPISRKLLYSLAKIQKEEDIIKKEPEILNHTLTDVINIGNNINTVEPLCDFNGYSWNVAVIDIENFYYNIIYQDLIILVGNEFLEEWSNKYNETKDYMELFQNRLRNNYGNELTSDILEKLKSLSLYLELNVNKDFILELKERKKYIQEELAKMKNKEKYLDDVSKEKRKITADIKRIDIILNNKEILTKEYEKRNNDLPLEEKIFSKRVLKEILQEERKQEIEKLQEYTQKMKSENFLNMKAELEYEDKYLFYIDKTMIKKETFEQVINFQNFIFKAFKNKLENATNREEIIKMLYEIRYFNLIPIDTTKTLSDIGKIKKELREIRRIALEKAIEFKILNEIATNQDLSYKILDNIFFLNIIKLEDIKLKFSKDKEEKYYIQFYDDNTEDKRFEINVKIEDLKIKLNKKIKLFI